MFDGALRESARGFLIDVDVRPGAASTRLTGFHEGRHSFRIDIAAKPEKGEANRALATFLTKLAGPGATVAVVRGAASRRKTVLVAGVTKAALLAAIARGLP